MKFPALKDQVEESDNLTAEREATAGSASPEADGLVGQALRDLFAAPQFNVTDGLDDYAANYRVSPPGRVLTSVLSRRQASSTPPSQETPPQGPSMKGRAEDRAPAHTTAVAGGEPPTQPGSLAGEAPALPEAVRYLSPGRVLIAGPLPRVQRAARRLAGSTSPWLLIQPETGAPVELGRSGLPGAVGTLTRLEGVLGRFQAWAETEGREESRAPGPDAELFDLVLDLQEPPVLRGPFLPLGYFAPAGDEAALEAALQEIPELVGEFESPRFLRYRPALCAHGHNRPSGCSRCEAVCPAGAVSTQVAGVQFDLHNCVECGACAAACPAGALALEAPWVEGFRAELDAVLAGNAPASGPTVLLCGEGQRDPGGEAGSSTFVPRMESVWAAGLELWLAAVAAGAGGVHVALPDDAPQGVLDEFRRQLRTGRALLAALGYGEELFATTGGANGGLGTGDASGVVDLPTARTTRLRELWEPADRRGSIRRALATLRALAPAPPAEVELPAGEAFGEVRVDGDRCTLCLACASVCPSGALRAGTERPELRFVEAACTQCGRCLRVCPEAAVELRSRYHFAAQEEGGERLLHGSAPLCCARCGAPFASPRMIERVAERLVGHWMFPDEMALRRLRMCGNCRVADLLESEGPAGREAGA